MKPLFTIALPAESKLKADLIPLLQGSLGLEETSDGELKTTKLPSLKIITARIDDIIDFLREGLVDAGFISDDRALENCKATYELRREFGLRVEKPAKLRYLVRNEDVGRLRERLDYGESSFGVERCAVTSFPEILARTLATGRVFGGVKTTFLPELMLELKGVGRGETMEYAERSTTGSTTFGTILRNYEPAPNLNGRYYNGPELICKPEDRLVIKRVNGQVERYLRNGVFADAVFCLDLVRSGKTAEINRLTPLFDPVMTAYPSLWTSSNCSTNAAKSDTLSLLKERIQSMVSLTYSFNQ